MFNTKFKYNKADLISLMLIISGLGFSFAGSTGICADSCSDAHKYNFMLFDMNILGAVYFISLLGALALRFFKGYKWPYAYMLAGGVGAEIWFTAVQARLIGHVCMLCVMVALAMLGLVIIEFWQFMKVVMGAQQLRQKASIVVKKLGIVFVMCAGLLTAVIGLGREPDISTDAAVMGNQISKTIDLGLGRKGADLSIYVVTDWFCPACIRVEPEVEQIYRESSNSANFFFIDMVVHGDSLEYIPYNSQFLANEKDKYIDIRKALTALAVKTRKPSFEEIAAAVKPLGVKPKPVDYRTALWAMQANHTVTNALKISSTPTIVVASKRSGKTVKLTGKEIKLEKLRSVIKELTI